MDVAALVAWIATATGGVVMLAIWVARGGLRQQQTGVTRFPALAVFAHAGLAASGLAVWVLYLASDDADGLAWLAVVVLVVVAVIGVMLFVRWLGVRSADRAPVDDEPAERNIPVVAAIGHGVAAVATVTLVVLAAAGVGT